MYKLSEPVFLSNEEAEKYKKDGKHGLAVCQCPIPIYLHHRVNAHIVDYNTSYMCKKCGTKMVLFHT